MIFVYKLIKNIEATEKPLKSYIALMLFSSEKISPNTIVIYGFRWV